MVPSHGQANRSDRFLAGLGSAFAGLALAIVVFFLTASQLHGRSLIFSVPLAGLGAMVLGSIAGCARRSVKVGLRYLGGSAVAILGALVVAVVLTLFELGFI